MSPCIGAEHWFSATPSPLLFRCTHGSLESIVVADAAELALHASYLFPPSPPERYFLSSFFHTRARTLRSAKRGGGGGSFFSFCLNIPHSPSGRRSNMVKLGRLDFLEELPPKYKTGARGRHLFLSLLPFSFFLLSFSRRASHHHRENRWNNVVLRAVRADSEHFPFSNLPRKRSKIEKRDKRRYLPSLSPPSPLISFGPACTPDRGQWG